MPIAGAAASGPPPEVRVPAPVANRRRVKMDPARPWKNFGVEAPVYVPPVRVDGGMEEGSSEVKGKRRRRGKGGGKEKEKENADAS